MFLLKVCIWILCEVSSPAQWWLNTPTEIEVKTLYVTHSTRQLWWSAPRVTCSMKNVDLSITHANAQTEENIFLHKIIGVTRTALGWFSVHWEALFLYVVNMWTISVKVNQGPRFHYEMYSFTMGHFLPACFSHSLQN